MRYLPAPIFFVIAFVFSMLGMRGSQLYIPILVWTGMDFKTEAIPLGILLNLVNSASATATYGREGIVGWRVALPYAATMIVFAPLGARLNVRLPTKPLLPIAGLIIIKDVVLGEKAGEMPGRRADLGGTGCRSRPGSRIAWRARPVVHGGGRSARSWP